MSEQQGSEPGPILDAESAVLHAIAIIQHEERMVMAYHAVRSHRDRAAADNWSNRHEKLYRQLDKAVDEATEDVVKELGFERSKKRRDDFMAIAASIGAAVGSAIGMATYLHYMGNSHL